MTTLMTVFMVFAIMMCVFSALVITREIVLDSMQRRGQKTQAAEKPVPVETEEIPAPAPVEEAPGCEEAEEETAIAQEATSDDSVRFSKSSTQTLEEKYLALDNVSRGYYDEIVKYAAAKEGAKRIKNTRYEEYKVGKTRLVRLLVKRGAVTCEFILPNADFKNYVNENRLNVKNGATVMKVTDKATEQAAKDSIDIVVNALAEEREYKKQLARERRRKNRQNKKA